MRENRKPVLLLEGFFDAEIYRRFLRNIFIPPCITKNSFAALEEASTDEPVTVWMKLDTGMHRLGVRPEQAEAFYHRLTQCKNVRQPVNIVSHFARADEPKCDATEKQLAIFNTFCEGKPGQRSIAASGWHFTLATIAFDWVRRALFFTVYLRWKIAPPVPIWLSASDVTNLNLIAVREHKAGEPVGYGGTWVSERDTRLGVVAMGYGDGYPRAAPSRYASAGKRSRSAGVGAWRWI